MPLRSVRDIQTEYKGRDVGLLLWAPSLSEVTQGSVFNGDFVARGRVAAIFHECQRLFQEACWSHHVDSGPKDVWEVYVWGNIMEYFPVSFAGGPYSH